jgi:hypothetical protein
MKKIKRFEFLAGVVLLYLMIKIASESAEIQESSADQFFQNTSAAHQVKKISSLKKKESIGSACKIMKVKTIIVTIQTRSC